jgi:hypothetical protein
VKPVATIASALALALFGPATTMAQPATPKALAAQTSRGGGVTVSVTPKDVAADAQRWQFEVVFDTHTVDLNHDVVKSAELIDAAGGRHAPLAWDGDPPGGHHRKGVLSFKPLGSVDEVRLQIREVGMPERVFRWSLKGQAR